MFKAGDKVICINPGSHEELELHAVYTVYYCTTRGAKFVSLVEDHVAGINWNISRFLLATDLMLELV